MVAQEIALRVEMTVGPRVRQLTHQRARRWIPHQNALNNARINMLPNGSEAVVPLRSASNVFAC
jgi:hypothetical protein